MVLAARGAAAQLSPAPGSSPRAKSKTTTAKKPQVPTCKGTGH